MSPSSGLVQYIRTYSFLDVPIEAWKSTEKTSQDTSLAAGLVTLGEGTRLSSVLGDFHSTLFTVTAAI